MSRDTAINALLGTVLVSAFAVVCFAYGTAAVLVLYAINASVNHYFPAVAHPWNVLFFGLISLGILAACARQIRKRLWTNAFLSFIAAVTIVVPWLLNANPHPGVGGAALRFPLAWFIALLLPYATRISRAEFTACASIITVAFVLNIGLLGSGLLSTLTGIALFIAIARWVLVNARDGKYGDPWDFFLPSGT